MKPFSFILLFLFLSSCNCHQQKTETTILTDAIPNQDTAIANKSTGSIMGRYAADTLIPEEFKKVYANPHLIFDTGLALSIPDSLFSRDKQRQRFYFLLTDLVMDISDGAYSEHLYMTVAEYAQTHPAEMLDYLNNDEMLSEKSYKKWASGVLSEIGISCEHQEDTCITILQKRMHKNCPGCSPKDGYEIDRFADTLRAELKKWNTENYTTEN